MLLVANLVITKWCKKLLNITETMANGYSFKSTHQELSNDFEYDRAHMHFKIFVSLCFNESILIITRLKPWQMGTHLKVLSKSYAINNKMTGFRWISKIFVSLCL